MSRNQKRDKQKFLEALRKMPIIEAACKQVGVPRATVYRWRREDVFFARDWNRAIEESYTVVTDIAMTQLVKQIQAGSLSAVVFALRHLHPKFRPKIPQPEESPTPLTPIQIYPLRPLDKIPGLIIEDEDEAKGPEAVPPASPSKP